MLPDRKTADRAQATSRTEDPRLARTRRIACGYYEVQGRTGVYTIRVDASGYTCDCVAGANGRTCWHEASVYRLRLAEKLVRQPVNAPPAPPARKSMSLVEMYDQAEGLS